MAEGIELVLKQLFFADIEDLGVNIVGVTLWDCVFTAEGKLVGRQSCCPLMALAALMPLISFVLGISTSPDGRVVEQCWTGPSLNGASFRS